MFEDYFSDVPEDVEQALTALVEHVLEVAPDATEGRSYGLPALRHNGKPLLGFAAHKDHLGLYPFSAAVVEELAGRLEGFERSKGTIRFSPEHPIPADVVADIVRSRMREIDGG